MGERNVKINRFPMKKWGLRGAYAPWRDEIDLDDSLSEIEFQIVLKHEMRHRDIAVKYGKTSLIYTLNNYVQDWYIWVIFLGPAYFLGYIIGRL